MGFTGHRGLADQLLPTPAAMQAEVTRFARAELLSEGWQILAQHIDRRMNVRRGTFADAIRPSLVGSRSVPVMHWLVDHPGADIQDRGGVIEAKPGRRMLFKIPGVGFRSASRVKLTARNYLAPALADIQQHTATRLENHLAAWLRRPTP